MNADQLAEIRPVLREVVDGAPDTCATLEVDGDNDKWVQVVDRTINAVYPHDDDPQKRIAALGLHQPMPTLVSWEARKFATFEFAHHDVLMIATWIDSYFVRVLGCANGDYHLNARLEKI